MVNHLKSLDNMPAAQQPMVLMRAPSLPEMVADLHILVVGDNEARKSGVQLASPTRVFKEQEAFETHRATISHSSQVGGCMLQCQGPPKEGHGGGQSTHQCLVRFS